MKKTLTVAKSFQLKADCLLNNQDLLVNLTGGNIPHIGGVVTFDRISKEQIDDSFVMTDEIAKKILVWVQEETANFKDPTYTTHLKRDVSGKLI